MLRTQSPSAHRVAMPSIELGVATRRRSAHPCSSLLGVLAAERIRLTGLRHPWPASAMVNCVAGMVHDLEIRRVVVVVIAIEMVHVPVSGTPAELGDWFPTSVAGQRERATGRENDVVVGVPISGHNPRLPSEAQFHYS